MGFLLPPFLQLLQGLFGNAEFGVIIVLVHKREK